MTSTSFSVTAAGTLAALIALPAFAQTRIDVEASAAAEAEFTAVPLTKPLDAVKARAQEIKQNALRGMEAASGTPPMKIMERPINARVVETASSTPRGSLTSLVRMHIGNIVQRLTSVTAHLLKFLDRIEARIDKMEADGMDVDAIVVLHLDAVDAVATAEADLAALKTVMESVKEADDRAAARARIDAAVTTARESVRQAHHAVKTTVAALVAAAKADASAQAEVDVDNE